MNASCSVVFFDIDGTLVHMAGAGRKAFARALTRVFGLHDAIEYIEFAGATDLDVLDRILTQHGLRPTPAEIDAFFAALPEEFEHTVHEADPEVFPGVPELLQVLTEDDRFLLGLVTGNIASCARQKLAHFDLHGHFFLGAFGHEHADRNQIAQLALQRAREHLEPDRTIGRTFLIGDTPADIQAAHAIGATAIAVTTGTYRADQLQDANADHVLEGLSNLTAVLHLLLSEV
jgi:phosphoglycolate phosphatase-like HAD superfamily hydrolase